FHVYNRSISLELQDVQSGRPYQQPNPADGTQHNRNAEVRMRCLPTKERMISSGNRCGSKAEKKSVEGQMMEPSSPLRVALIGIGAAGAVTVEILQRHRVAYTLKQNSRLEERGEVLSRFAPEPQEAASLDNDDRGKDYGERSDHHVMRDHAVEVCISRR